MQNLVLDDLGDWGSGGTPLASKREYYNGNIPWLIIEDLNDDLITQSKSKITELGLQNSSAKMVEPGTLLIAMYGSVGKLGIARINCCTNQAIAFCKPYLDIVDVKYLFYFLMSNKNKLIYKSRGGTQQNINQDMLKTYPIELPALEEQKRLASILDKADHLRQFRKYALKLTDSFLQSVFLEMFGDPTTNPKDWKKARIDELGTVQTGNTPPRIEVENYGDYIEWIKTDNILEDEIYISQSKEKLSEIGYKKGRILEPGSILITSIAGSEKSIGNVCLTDRRISFNQQINAITPFKDVESFFFMGTFKSIKTYYSKE